MLAILSLLGIALTASAFVDSAPRDETDDDVANDMGAGSTEAGDGGHLTFDIPQDDTDTPEEPEPLEHVEIGTFGNDWLVGTDGADRLIGGAGDDDLQGGRGDDTLEGEDGDDDLWGHVGNDHISGGAGADLLNGGDGDDLLDGGEDDDTLAGSWGHDQLFGGAGVDLLQGGAGNDLLDGGEGSDFLNGGDGDDMLIAMDGDNLNGGDGADTFRLTDVSDTRIDDFDAETDTIEIQYDGIPPTLSTQVQDDSLVLLADGAPVATLSGVTVLDLSKVLLTAA